MAQRKGWTVVISLLVGAALATAFWLHSPGFIGRLTGPGTGDSQAQKLAVEIKGEGADLKKVGVQALGPRFQMVTDGRQVFLADLQDGRVWRYYHYTKEGGFAREDEGFISVPLYFGGKKHYSAVEAEPPAGKSPDQSSGKPGEKKPQ